MSNDSNRNPYMQVILVASIQSFGVKIPI